MSHSLNTAEVNTIKQKVENEDFVWLMKAIRAKKFSAEQLIEENIMSESEIDRKLITSEDHLQKVRTGEYDFRKIKGLVGLGILQRHEVYPILRKSMMVDSSYRERLYESRIWSEDEIDASILHETDHITAIKRKAYSNDKIKSLLKKRILNENAILATGTVSEDELSVMLTGALPDLEVPDLHIDNVPSLISGRTDIFVFGISGSGKSTFMAGLMYYANKEGKAINRLSNVTGRNYANILIRSIKEGRLIKRNAGDDLHYMTIDLLNGEREHPLTFFEMAGEAFQKYYDEAADFHPKLQEYLVNSSNRKIFFLVIDSSEVKGHQNEHLDNIVQVLNQKGVLSSTDAISILLTKWDVNEGKVSPVEFMRENYKALHVLCDRLERESTPKRTFFRKAKPRLKYEIMTFSLGDFEGERKYSYNPKSSQDIFNWIISFTNFR